MHINQETKTQKAAGAKDYSMQQLYEFRLYFRLLVALSCFLLYFFKAESFHVLSGWAFFRRFSWLHVIWAVWMANMLAQLLPGSSNLLLGSRKQFDRYHQPAAQSISSDFLAGLTQHSRQTRLKVAGIWILLTGLIAGLRFTGIISTGGLLLLTAVFYVVDLVCILFWCPFRTLVMKNRCCTTCMIFNWDHMMIFTPAVLIGGFFAVSLFTMSLVVLIFWEIRIAVYPQRFFDQTNKALTCESCTDRLCDKADETVT